MQLWNVGLILLLLLLVLLIRRLRLLRLHLLHRLLQLRLLEQLFRLLLLLLMVLLLLQLCLLTGEARDVALYVLQVGNGLLVLFQHRGVDCVPLTRWFYHQFLLRRQVRLVVVVVRRARALAPSDCL